jgi:hypothetical protein
VPKFSYTKRKQVKIKPKSTKFSYTKRGQIKFKPRKKHESKLADLAKSILLEIELDKMAVVNPQTKNKIKVTSALKYPKEHPAHKAAVALLKKKKVTVPSGDELKYKKPGTQGTLFNLEPFEDPAKAYKRDLESAIRDEDAEELLKKQYSFLEHVDGEVKESIEKYTGIGYRYMNAFLRGDVNLAHDYIIDDNLVDTSDEYWTEDADAIIDENIKYLDFAFEDKATTLQDNILVYRGIDSIDVLEDFTEAGIGSEFSDDGFVSTSVLERVADKFTGNGMLKIIAKRGTKAIYPDGASLGAKNGTGGERELILQRGMSFRILEINRKKISKYREITEIVCETVSK